MKLLQKIVLLVLFSSYLFGAEHCIQVTGVNRFNPEHIKPAYAEIFENFDKARIDKRGRRLVLRVGSYKNASSAKRDLRKIRRRYRSAFIRRCDYDASTAIYPVFEDKVEEMPRKKVAEVEIVDNLEDELVMDIPQEDVVEMIDEPVEEIASVPAQSKEPAKPFKYTKQKKYNYEFWQECQKCFAPISNEASGNYEEIEESSEDNTIDEEIEDDVVVENAMNENESEIITATAKPLRRRNEKVNEKKSEGWFSSLFSFSSSDDEVEDDEDTVEIDMNDDENVYENETSSTNNDNIFSDDKSDISEPVVQNTDVKEESGSYYDNN